MSNTTFQNYFNDLVENFSENFDDMFRKRFNFNYPHEIPGLAEYSSAEILYQLDPSEYFRKREEWASFVDKEFISLLRAIELYEAQDALDNLAYDFSKGFSWDRDKHIYSQYEQIVSSTGNDEMVVEQISFLVENEWGIKDIVQEIDSRIR